MITWWWIPTIITAYAVLAILNATLRKHSGFFGDFLAIGVAFVSSFIAIGAWILCFILKLFAS